jgi:hypothetical protein
MGLCVQVLRPPSPTSVLLHQFAFVAGRGDSREVVLTTVSIVLLIGAVITVLAVTSRKGVLSERRRYLLDLAVALLATYCGVAWALKASDLAAAKTERREVIGLLRAARGDVLQSADRLADYIKSDSTFSPPLSDLFVSVTPVPTPVVLAAVIQRESVVRNMSPLTFRVIVNAQEGVEAGIALAKATGDVAGKRKVFQIVGSNYFMIVHGLDGEIDFLEGKATAQARLSMTKHWVASEVNGDNGPGTWRYFVSHPLERKGMFDAEVELEPGR